MILKLILQFLIGIGVGVYSYLSPGYINLGVMQLSGSERNRHLLKTLILISLIEIPYAVGCLSGMQWLMQQQTLMLIIRWLIVAVLFLMAALTLYDAGKEAKKRDADDTAMDKSKFIKLLVFVIFNPFQISAWAIWGAYFIEKDWFDWSLLSIFVFSAGASIGVFIILKMYAFMGKKLVEFFQVQKKNVAYAVAVILLVLAVVQLIRNLM